MGSHTRNALTVKSIAASKAVKLRDGGGLWLVTKGGGRYWIFSYTFAGMRREMGLGPLHTVGLADAREKAEEARAMVRRGLDPIAARKEEQADTPKLTTFGAYADAFIDAAVKAGRWRGAKTEARWRNLLENHAKPIRAKSLASIKTKDVIAVLNPIWGSKQETAEKLREAIERVLDAAKVEGHRAGENPAAWKGNLEHAMHKPNQLAATSHHAAVPYVELPAFMKTLSKVGGVSARALELAILTACRSGEVRGAVWSEVDLKAKVWTIPPVRMKSGKLHRVPLSDEAVRLFKKMKEQSINDLVFPGSETRSLCRTCPCRKPSRPLGVVPILSMGFDHPLGTTQPRSHMLRERSRKPLWLTPSAIPSSDLMRAPMLWSAGGRSCRLGQIIWLAHQQSPLRRNRALVD